MVSKKGQIRFSPGIFYSVGIKGVDRTSMMMTNIILEKCLSCLTLTSPGRIKESAGDSVVLVSAQPRRRLQELKRAGKESSRKKRVKLKNQQLVQLTDSPELGSHCRASVL